MSNAISKAKNLVLGIIAVLKSFKSAYKHGGIATYQISTIHRSQLLAGKSILLTGGSTGIGFAIARRCIEEGARVVITGRGSEKLAEAARRISSDSLHVLAWDVGDCSCLKGRLIEAQKLLGGNIDILVNNAGILLPQTFPDITEQIWDETYQVNSKGLFFLTQEISKCWLAEQKNAIRKILNISSQGGFVGATYPYRMTKWDVAGLTQGLGIRLAEHGIIVNGIAPGIVGTAMQPDCIRRPDNIYHHSNPVKRYALPEEIAELAVFMLSDASNFIVGQTILCDGGYSIK